MKISYLKKTRRIQLMIGMVLIYLMGYSYIKNSIIISSFTAGIIIGMGIGAWYIQEKIIETKKELKDTNV
jgi:hypothetical protein